MNSLEMLFLISLISLYVSIIGFVHKAGYPLAYGIIPLVNIYFFLKILDINPLLLAFLGLGLIFLPDRMFIATMIFVFLPFIVANAFGKKLYWGILTFILPFIMYPYLAFFNGIYVYNKGRDLHEIF